MVRQTSLACDEGARPIDEDGLEASIARGLSALGADLAHLSPHEPYLIDVLALELLAQRIADSAAPEGLKALLARNLADILLDTRHEAAH
jgi:hypothetical protein